MHWSQALSRSHTQPILMPRTPPCGKGPDMRRKRCLHGLPSWGLGVVMHGHVILPIH